LDYKFLNGIETSPVSTKRKQKGTIIQILDFDCEQI